jgi:hypothetical protein
LVFSKASLNLDFWWLARGRTHIGKAKRAAEYPAKYQVLNTNY